MVPGSRKYSACTGSSSASPSQRCKHPLDSTLLLESAAVEIMAIGQVDATLLPQLLDRQIATEPLLDSRSEDDQDLKREAVAPAVEAQYQGGSSGVRAPIVVLGTTMSEAQEGILAPGRDDGRQLLEATSIVIVSHDSTEFLPDCIASVKGVGSMYPSLIVVDAFSSDGTAEMLRSQTFGDITPVLLDHNPGFGTAANTGVSQVDADSRFVLILNADCVILPSTISSMVYQLMGDPRLGCVAPEVLLDEVRGGQKVGHEFRSARREFRLLVAPSGSTNEIRSQERMTTGWVVCAAVLFRLSAFREVGGFPQHYFMYAEDIDICWRLQECGWQTALTRGASARHIGGASATQRWSDREIRARKLTNELLFYDEAKGELASRVLSCLRLLRVILRRGNSRRQAVEAGILARHIAFGIGRHRRKPIQ
jgi:N-acetylglucosaminyl-diphospho-decaprenol L-rhamnosyltransferase